MKIENCDIDFSGMNEKVAKKIYLNPKELALEVERLRKKRKKIIFTNGRFDLLHAGHVRCLYGAKDLGDILIVAVNTDESVKMYKPNSVLAQHAYERIEIIAAIGAVDYVIPLREKTPIELLSLLKPDIHTKGPDYTLDNLPERETVKSYGGKIAFVGGPKIRSSTQIKKEIRNM